MSKDVEASPPSQGAETTQDAAVRARRPWWQLLVPGALAVLLVAGLVVGIVAYSKYRGERSDQQARQEVTSVAQQFALRLDAIDYKDLADYQKQVAELLTTKMRTDFTENYKSFEPAFKAIQITSKGEVRASGVADIDQDSATVLVIHDVDVTAKGCVQPPYKRMSVDLQKVKGKWLVSDFTEDVPGCQS